MARKRRILNHHKLKKKIKNKLTKRSRNFSSSRNRVASPYKHNKDHSWKKRKKNPYEKGEKHSKLKNKIKIITIILSIIGIIGVGLYHSFFRINSVNITGLHRINQSEIEQSVQSILNYKKLFIFPGDNYFITDVDEIRDILIERFPINKIEVIKTFPKTIEINIEEKIATIIYDNSHEYVKLGIDGFLTEKIRKVWDDEWTEITTTTITITEELNEDGEIIQKETKNTEVIERFHTPNSTQLAIEVGDYPIVFDKTNTTENIPNKEITSPTIIKNVITVYERLKKHTDIPLKHISIENKQGSTIIHTAENWQIKLNTKVDDIEDQLNTLEHLLQSEKINRATLDYIDLQFLPQVYWK